MSLTALVLMGLLASARAEEPASEAGTENLVYEGQDRFTARDYLLLPLLPYRLVLREDRMGFQAYPYPKTPSERGLTFAQGPRALLQRVDAVYQRASDSIGGLGARYRLLHENRLGFDGSWTRWHERDRRVDFQAFDASLTGAFVQDDDALVWFGAGVAGRSSSGTRAGPGARVGADWAFIKPLMIEGAFALSYVEPGLLGDVRASAGVELWRLELRGGWRELFGPVSHLHGPEASLAIWF